MFDDIKPYDDYQVPEAIAELLQSKALIDIAYSFLPTIVAQQIIQNIQQVKTIYEFQKCIIYPIVEHLIKTTTTSFSFTGIEHLSRNKGHLFISNHRDIVMDAAFISFILFSHGIDTAEIGIGDNLLQERWIEHLVRLNRSFIVRRNLKGRQLLKASRQMSSYIGYAVRQKKTNVWLSQREGRAKDANDMTQTAVLKMLAMSNNDMHVSDYFNSLNITPVSITYEFDPCDALKAFQLLQSKKGKYKQKDEDLLHMQTGILGFKGNVHIHFCEPIRLSNQISPCDVLAFYDVIATEIDKRIHSHYKIYPVHYLCWDRLHKTHQFADYYTDTDAHVFDQMIFEKLKGLHISVNEQASLKELIYLQYANVLKNYLSATG